MKSMLHMLELRDYDERLLASKCCADKKKRDAIKYTWESASQWDRKCLR